MADKTKFRIPSLQEIDTANEANTIVSAWQNRNFRKSDTTNERNQNIMHNGSSLQTQPHSSPKKRMLSQKALLSRQPLSKSATQAKQKVSPGKEDNAKSKTVEPVRKGESFKEESNKLLPLTLQEQSQVVNGAINDNKKVISNTVSRISFASSSAGSASNNSTGGNCQTMLGKISTFTVLQDSEKTCPSSNSAGETHPGINTAGECSTQASDSKDDVTLESLPTLAKLGKSNSLIVNPRQRGNQILKFVRTVPWEYGNIVPDFVMGQCNCALFLSLRYHQLHPEYIHSRLKQLGRSFDLRVLLVQVDLKDPHHLLKELAKICILADCTLMLAFSAEEAGRYLETYKVYENKAAEAIMERSDENFSNQLTDCMTRVKSVNKTDCVTLMATFKSMQAIMEASVEDISMCPGFGPQKAKRLHDVFREPFLVAKKQREVGKQSFGNHKPGLSTD